MLNMCIQSSVYYKNSKLTEHNIAIYLAILLIKNPQIFAILNEAIFAKRFYSTISNSQMSFFWHEKY